MTALEATRPEPIYGHSEVKLRVDLTKNGDLLLAKLVSIHNEDGKYVSMITQVLTLNLEEYEQIVNMMGSIAKELEDKENKDDQETEL